VATTAEDTHHSARPRFRERLTLATLRLIARLPWRAALRAGDVLGMAFYHLAPKRRGVAARNLELCFPDLGGSARKQLLRDNFRFLGRGLAETALAWYGDDAVDRVPLELVGVENLNAAQAGGRPVILLSGHFMCVEIVARLAGPQIHAAVIYKPLSKKPLLDAAMYRGRARNLGGVLARDDIRGIVRTLKAGTPVWYAGDQDYGRRHSVFAPFFGIPAATITALTRLTRMSNARVVPLFFEALPGSRGYRLTFHPALEDFPTGDAVEDAARMNQVVEAAVRRNPAQYLWIHRRFKRRPEGAEPLYADALQRPRHRRKRA
jgi:KDO2-lipid IV(A) lauroyltransferase